jgi:hypothetical protein
METMMNRAQVNRESLVKAMLESTNDDARKMAESWIALKWVQKPLDCPETICEIIDETENSEIADREMAELIAMNAEAENSYNNSPYSPECDD